MLHINGNARQAIRAIQIRYAVYGEFRRTQLNAVINVGLDPDEVAQNVIETTPPRCIRVFLEKEGFYLLVKKRIMGPIYPEPGPIGQFPFERPKKCLKEMLKRNGFASEADWLTPMVFHASFSHEQYDEDSLKAYMITLPRRKNDAPAN